MHVLIALLIGGISGYLANLFINNKNGSIFTNILIGIVGGVLGDLLFSVLGVSSSGILGNIIISIIGASLLLFLINKFIK